MVSFFGQKNTRNFQPQSLAKWIASTKDIYATRAIRVRAFLGSFARASWSWEGHAFSERGWEKKEAEFDLEKLKFRQNKSMNIFNIVRFKTPECSTNDTTIAIGSLTGFYFCRLTGTAKVPWHQ